MNKIKQELKGLEPKELAQKVDALRRELFSLRLQNATNPVKDHQQLKKLRRGIACALTLLNQRAEEI